MAAHPEQEETTNILPDLGSAVEIESLSHRYGKVKALAGVSLHLPRGKIVGIIGPDGVGKSTLFALIAGAKKIQTGAIKVLGQDMIDARQRRDILPKIAFMPQGLGKNLYSELSVFENLDFFGRLFGQAQAERHARIDLLINSTGLAAFVDRPAGKLSGGMKQKLGLCCALIHDPDLLILDEPTTGVDPLSRRQFWALIDRLRKSRPEMSVLVSTAYMDEAEAFDHLIAIVDGSILAQGSSDEIRASTQSETLEQAYAALLPNSTDEPQPALTIPPFDQKQSEIVIKAEGLTKKFGNFTAVDSVDFEIRRGEIFGFLGPNGCGKTTTMRMLTALLEPTEGQSWLLGAPANASAIEMRKRVGFMSQAFSLYTELTVRQNLVLHGRLFHLSEDQIHQRIERLVDQFGLSEYEDENAEKLPLGVRQRLSLAVAIIHEPEILILDEPTSGVDPVARDDFWRQLIDLSRNSDVTIFISTHFMNEAERCDRLSFMDAGQVLATDSPAALKTLEGAETLEDAFISFLSKTRHDVDIGDVSFQKSTDSDTNGAIASIRNLVSLKRLLAVAHRESLELVRDPIRTAVAFLGTAILMIIFGYGITFDVENLHYAALDHDRSPESRTYLEGFSGSRYFTERPPPRNAGELDENLKSGDIALALEIPAGFGKALIAGTNPEISAYVDGAMPARGNTILGYVQAEHISYLEDMATRIYGEKPSLMTADIGQRYRYNQAFKSIYAIAPAIIAILLIFIPAILMTVGVVRERELGTITNFYVTPTSKIDFLFGKQLPYIGISMVNFLILVLLAIFLFKVPLKGDFFGLTLCALTYVTATTGIGLFVSTLTRSQLAAIIGTAVLTMTPTLHFSGLISPVSSLEGTSRIIGDIWPTTYFLKSSVGAFTKGLGFAELIPFLGAIAVFLPVVMLPTYLLMQKQDR